MGGDNKEIQQVSVVCVFVLLDSTARTYPHHFYGVCVCVFVCVSVCVSVHLCVYVAARVSPTLEVSGKFGKSD